MEDQWEFEFPTEPEQLPNWAIAEAAQWADLSEFDLLVKAEEISGKRLEIKRVSLSSRLWGFTFSKKDGTRARIFINKDLPEEWQQFALYHELYHLLHDARGVYFYSHTLMNLHGVECRADTFAWAVMLAQERQEGYSA